MNLPKPIAWILALFQNSIPARIVIAVFILLFILTFAIKCRAADFEVGGGATVVRGPAPVMALHVVWPEIVAGADLRVNLTLVGASSFYGAHQPNNFMVGGQVVNGFGPIDLGLGIAALRNQDAYNSGGLNFNLSIGWHIWRSATIEYMHYSDAGSHAPNLGRDMVLAVWRFQ